MFELEDFPVVRWMQSCQNQNVKRTLEQIQTVGRSLCRTDGRYSTFNCHQESIRSTFVSVTHTIDQPRATHQSEPLRSVILATIPCCATFSIVVFGTLLCASRSVVA